MFNKSFYLKETIKLARVEEETQVSRMTQSEEDHFEMLVRASNIVGWISVLVYLSLIFSLILGQSWRVVNVTDLKQYLILNDFPSANEAIGQSARSMLTMQQESDRKLMTLRDDLAADLYDLEEEYYSSPFK